MRHKTATPWPATKALASNFYAPTAISPVTSRRSRNEVQNLSSFLYFLFIKKREDQDPDLKKEEKDQDLLYGCPGSGQVVRIASISYRSYLHWIRAGLPLN